MINDFKTIKEVDKETIEKYRGKLPDEYLDIWQEHGYCTFYGGYLKVINPDEYISLVKESYFLGDASIPIMATAFGDILTWEENQYVGILKYRYNDNDIVSYGFEFFFDIIEDEECAAEYFTIKKYNAAVKKYGELEYDECFGYVPLLALGGKESVDNLKKVKMKEHIELIYSMVGGI
ncbi:MAG: DUF1851 domain-containing protein [Ruminococcus sp.]|uniref:T6SS immunity protein Tdi1 domain-containing protein n=1 Tax=Ruminococcus sp. TaxID=41978 RepID=UPI0025DC9B6D|nr:T6SS immunity protein Tdi1 domain-containing protein [Ruminococcus sp.]MBR0529331.1 DUF1851 domain-containing protein [Ruminococcus sp.]